MIRTKPHWWQRIGWLHDLVYAFDAGLDAWCSARWRRAGGNPDYF
jgi:hypothetical protein